MNQCEGCQRGLSLVDRFGRKVHRDSNFKIIICTAYQYKKKDNG